MAEELVIPSESNCPFFLPEEVVSPEDFEEIIACQNAEKCEILDLIKGEKPPENEDLYANLYEICTKNDVDPNFISDMIFLARERSVQEEFQEFGVDQALNFVCEKYKNIIYPQNSAKINSISTGIKTGKSLSPLEGVEAAFLKRNPNIKKYL